MRPVAFLCGKDAAATKSGTARSPNGTSRCLSAFRVAIPPTPSCAKQVYPKRSDLPRLNPHARGVAEALARRGKAGEALALAQSIAEDTARADALRGIAQAMPE